MGGVDLLDQHVANYRLDRKSKFRFYLRIFFDLMDIAVTNAFIVFNTKYPEKKFTLLDYKIVVAKSLIGNHTNRVRSLKTTMRSKRSVVDAPFESPEHLPVFASSRSRCVYCSAEGVENRTYVVCPACNNKALCCVKERNCFRKYHL